MIKIPERARLEATINLDHILDVHTDLKVPNNTNKSLENAYAYCEEQLIYLNSYPGIHAKLSSTFASQATAILSISIRKDIEKVLQNYYQDTLIKINRINSYSKGDKDKFNLFVKVFHDWESTVLKTKTKEELIQSLGISRSTFFRYQKVYKTLSEEDKLLIIRHSSLKEE